MKQNHQHYLRAKIQNQFMDDPFVLVNLNLAHTFTMNLSVQHHGICDQNETLVLSLTFHIYVVSIVIILLRNCHL